MPDPLQDLELSLRAAIERSPEIREIVRSLGVWLESLADPQRIGRTESSVSPAERVSSNPRIAPPPIPTEARTPQASAVPAPVVLPTKRTTMRIGGQDVEVEVPYDITTPKTFGNPRVVDDAPAATDDAHGTWGTVTAAPDLSLVVTRAKVKADGCRWAVERRRLRSINADHITEIAPTDRSIVERAKAQPGCWVWMVDPNFVTRMPDDEALLRFAALYDNLAAAAELTRGIDGDDDRRSRFIERAVALLAEAQSALRIECEQTLDIEREGDQMEAYLWLKDYSQQFRIYIGQFMRLNDPADPAQHNRLAGDIASLKAQFNSYRSSAKVRTTLLNKVKYEAKRLAGLAGSGGGSEAEPSVAEIEEAVAHARTLDTAVAALLNEGTPPSDAGLRELIMPVEDMIPDAFEPSEAFQRVLIEIERFRASRDEKEGPPVPRAPSAEVKKAASMLEGKRMFIVGGIRNEMSRRAIERDLALAEAKWDSTVEHQSTAPFEPEVARADIVVVLVRFSGHAFVEDLGEMCNRYEKPYIRLPAGYSTAQIAHHVLKQASRKLVTES